MQNSFKKTILLSGLSVMFACEGNAGGVLDKPEILSLDVISYEDFTRQDPRTLELLEQALHEKGIVGIKGVPGYKEKVLKFIETAREFSALPEEVKEAYSPNRKETFLGFEKGREQFKRPDGRWVVDDLKVSYYALVPDSIENKWPNEIDLQTPFQDLGTLMSEMGKQIMEKIGLIGNKTGISLDGAPSVGRMLYYRKSTDSSHENPYWCGAHFDHGMFTALVPGFYFENGISVPEPVEAGLFVKTSKEGVFKKVVADDPDVMMFQVGEFGQLVSNDSIRATEHRVQKASGVIERYTMALFFTPANETIIHSSSELTKDSRYGGISGEPCSYGNWHQESINRYLVKDEKN